MYFAHRELQMMYPQGWRTTTVHELPSCHPSLRCLIFFTYKLSWWQADLSEHWFGLMLWREVMAYLCTAPHHTADNMWSSLFDDKSKPPIRQFTNICHKECHIIYATLSFRTIDNIVQVILSLLMRFSRVYCSPLSKHGHVKRLMQKWQEDHSTIGWKPMQENQWVIGRLVPILSSWPWLEMIRLLACLFWLQPFRMHPSIWHSTAIIYYWIVRLGTGRIGRWTLNQAAQCMY